jgi:hypothetical protein
MKLLRRPPRGLAQRISSPLRRPVDARGRPATELIPSVIGAGANLTAARRNDAIRHRAAEAERIADCNHPIADARIVIGEPDIGETGQRVEVNKVSAAAGRGFPAGIAGPRRRAFGGA